MNASARLTTLTRIGFAARGLLYFVIAFLVIGTGRTEDLSGALRYLSEGGGRVLLILMTAGFVAYGIWRLSDAAFDVERHGSDGKGAAERVAAGASGLVHLFLAWQAVKLIQGVASSGVSGTQKGAATALALPGGAWLLTLAGAVILAVGGFQLIKTVKGDFLQHLEPQVASNSLVKWSGRAGYAARGIVFLISGAFLFQAGLDARAADAGGTAEALAWLSNPWDKIVALGLSGFGLFCLIEARYRTLHDVPVDGMVQQAKARARA